MQAYIATLDGIYFLHDGEVTRLDTATHVINADGSLTLRIPARDVVVNNAPDIDRSYDMTDIARLKLAVQYGGLTVAQISAVRPGVATAIQAWITANGIVPGTVQ